MIIDYEWSLINGHDYVHKDDYIPIDNDGDDDCIMFIDNDY